MKKLMTSWLACMVVFAALSPIVSLAEMKMPLRVVVDGRYLAFPDAQPYADENNRTQVPARFIAEALGADVTWHQEEEKASFVRGETTLVFYFGKKEYELNGRTKTMDTVALVQDNRTYVPVRYVAESFGALVEWDQDVWTVYITSDALPDPEPSEETTEYYDGIAFDSVADVDEWGRMSVEKSIQFTRNLADNIQFTKEDGELYIKGEYPELPEEYKWILAIRVFNHDGYQYSIRNDEVAREGYELPKEGYFTYHFDDLEVNEIDFVSVHILIKMKDASHLPRTSMASNLGNMIINSKSQNIGFREDVSLLGHLLTDFDFEQFYQWQ